MQLRLELKKTEREKQTVNPGEHKTSKWDFKELKIWTSILNKT